MKKLDKRKPADKPDATAPGPLRLLSLGLALILTAGSTWALLEFVIWNNLPAALVGKWVVVGGEQDGATFDFYRRGTMRGNINVKGKASVIQAQVAVAGDTLLITTQHPISKENLVKKQTIKILNGRELVLEDERKNELRLERAQE